MSFHVFISYRREGGFYPARLLYTQLQEDGYEPFFDIEEMDRGRFDEQLYMRIAECEEFVLVLPPKSLERCKNTDDYLRLEILEAMRLKKTIIPFILQGFEWPSVLPDGLESLSKYQGVVTSDFWYEASYEKLKSYMRYKPQTRPKATEQTGIWHSGIESYRTYTEFLSADEAQTNIPIYSPEHKTTSVTSKKLTTSFHERKPQKKSKKTNLTKVLLALVCLYLLLVAAMHFYTFLWRGTADIEFSEGDVFFTWQSYENENKWIIEWNDYKHPEVRSYQQFECKSSPWWRPFLTYEYRYCVSGFVPGQHYEVTIYPASQGRNSEHVFHSDLIMPQGRTAQGMSFVDFDVFRCEKNVSPFRIVDSMKQHEEAFFDDVYMTKFDYVVNVSVQMEASSASENVSMMGMLYLPNGKAVLLNGNHLAETNMEYMLPLDEDFFKVLSAVPAARAGEYRLQVWLNGNYAGEHSFVLTNE